MRAVNADTVRLMPPSPYRVRMALGVLLGCVGCGGPPAQAPGGARGLDPRDPRSPPDTAGPAGRTHVDGADLALDLPGHWDEGPAEGGHDLRNWPQQIVVALMPLAEGLDATGSAARLADAQKHGLGSLCKRGATASEPVPVQARPGAMRSHVGCDEPRVVATYVALPVENEVLSYEHYWYDVPVYSAALDVADDAILASVQVHPLATSCPSGVLAQTGSTGGACLEGAVLGPAVAERCGRALASRGWARDDAAAEAIRSPTAKTLVCYRRP